MAAAGGAVGLDPVPASAAPTVLGTGQTLGSSQSLSSPDGRFSLVMQGDGNLVMYGPCGPTWSSRTNSAANSGAYLVMQGDRNLVIYRSGTPIFATGTTGANAVLEVRGTMGGC